MSFSRARSSFASAARDTDDDAIKQIAEGLAELARALGDLESRLKNVENKVNRLD